MNQRNGSKVRKSPKKLAPWDTKWSVKTCNKWYKVYVDLDDDAFYIRSGACTVTVYIKAELNDPDFNSLDPH